MTVEELTDVAPVDDGVCRRCGGVGCALCDARFGGDMWVDLCAALGELTDPSASSTAEVPTKDGGRFSYKYAKLATILTAVRPVLARYGLAVVQLVESDHDTLSVTTVLRHRSGGSITSGSLTTRMLPNPQQMGGVVTYFRRYQLCALLGIAPEEDDDDAQAASRQAPPSKSKAAKRTAASEPEAPPYPDDVPPPSARRPSAELTDAQRRTIMGLFSSLGLSGDDMRDARLSFTCDAIGRTVTTTNDVTRDEAKELIRALIEANREAPHDDASDEGIAQ